jgi:23S rRNA (uracil1939-C5)-methyltransferase
MSQLPPDSSADPDTSSHPEAQAVESAPTPARVPLPKPGSTVTLAVESVAFGGRGLARIHGAAAFVEKALPGDVVQAVVLKRKPGYIEARALSRTQESPHRVEAPCVLFGTCGGCKWQDFDYDRQLEAKASQVVEALHHGARIRVGFEVLPPVPSPLRWRYRNKMEFAFGRERSSPFTGPESIHVGLHRPGDFRHVVPVDVCHLTPEPLEKALRAACAELRRQATDDPARVTVHDLKIHRGLLRHLVLRHSVTTGNWLAAFITTSDPFPGAEALARAIQEAAPGCAGVVWAINDGLSDVARPESIAGVWGEPVLRERLGNLEFRLSPFSFFQTNTKGAELLYEAVARFADLQGRERVLDAYCGTGTIGLYLAPRAQSVTGIELIEEAVEDARHNAERNGIGNAQFYAGDMKDVLADLHHQGVDPAQPPYDLVVIDPPRGGMDKKALRRLIDLVPPRLIYVSCNPSTLARDAVTLAEAGLRPRKVQAFDLFPHTYHVESVVEFVRDEG